VAWFRRQERVQGYPTSSNGASSMHLRWEPAPPPCHEVAVSLEILEPPTVDELYFWALQVSFSERGRHLGGAHLGLQWYSLHPGSTAVNWGGYRDGAGELDGEPSRLPSTPGNPNTRDFTWHPRRPYRLRISGDGDGWWTGSVTDLTTGQLTVVRRLHGGGDALTNPVVWSEVFAPCDAPTTRVRWSALSPPPDGLRVTYQSHRDGGCANSDVAVDDGGGVVQITSTARTIAHGAHLHP
jgi:hypothetical protein